MRTIGNAEELKGLVGQELGVSDWVVIDQKRIDLFAEATGDHQWIHVDPERAAKELPGGRTIAHGYLTLSLLPMLTTQITTYPFASRRINYGCNRVRFTNMVPSGSRLRARQKLLSLQEMKNAGLQVTCEVTFEIEGEDRPACIVESISILYP